MIAILSLPLFSFLAARDTPSHGYRAAAGESVEGGMAMVLDRWDLTEKSLVLGFTIRNESNQDIWYCDSVRESGREMEVFLDEATETLVLRRRLDVPTDADPYIPPIGRYVRLAAGEAHQQSVSFDLPIREQLYFSLGESRGIQHATRLALEIGFYPGDLPGMVRAILAMAARLRSATVDILRFEMELTYSEMTVLEQYFGGFVVEGEFGGVAGFERLNRGPALDKQVLIPYSYQTLKGEQCSRLVIDGVSLEVVPAGVALPGKNGVNPEWHFHKL